MKLWLLAVTFCSTTYSPNFLYCLKSQHYYRNDVQSPQIDIDDVGSEAVEEHRNRFELKGLISLKNLIAIAVIFTSTLVVRLVPDLASNTVHFFSNSSHNQKEFS